MAVIAVAAIAAFFVIPESRVTTAGKINWLAAGLLSGWLVALLLAVSEAPTWGWGSPKVLGLLIAAIVVAAAWVRLESASANPLIDMRMMSIRAVWTTNLVALLFGVAMFGTFAFLPAFLQTPSEAGYGFGASITMSGLMILPQTVGMFVLGVLAGRLGERFGSKNLVVAGSFLSAAALGLLALAHDHTWEVYLSSAVLGIGFGLAFSAMSNLIVAAVPAEQTGVASGMNANIRTIGGSLGAAFMASIVAAHVGPTGLPRESGYSTGFLLLAGALLLGAFAAILIPAVARSPKTRHEPAVELRHGELAMVAGGTVVGDGPE